MSIEALHRTEPPWMYLVVTTQSEITDFGWSIVNQQSRRVAVRFLRGKKMTSVKSAYNEFAAAIQFPWYFGENWDAFDECIADLAWIAADVYVLIITDSVAVLSQDDAEQFSILINTLERAGNEWSQQTESHPPIPFHVLFQCCEADKSDLMVRLSSAGASFEEIRIRD